MNMAGTVKLLGPVVLTFGLFPLSPVAATAPVPTLLRLNGMTGEFHDFLFSPAMGGEREHES